MGPLGLVYNELVLSLKRESDTWENLAKATPSMVWGGLVKEKLRPSGF